MFITSFFKLYIDCKSHLCWFKFQYLVNSWNCWYSRSFISLKPHLSSRLKLKCLQELPCLICIIFLCKFRIPPAIITSPSNFNTSFSSYNSVFTFIVCILNSNWVYFACYEWFSLKWSKWSLCLGCRELVVKNCIL